MSLSPLKIETAKYLKAGFSVIPVAGKQPTVDWREYQTRQPNLDELRAWFSKDPKGIGIVTGQVSGIVVVDVEKDADLKGVELPPTVMARSGGGGWHFYYKYPKDVFIKNSVKKLGEKIDVRSDGGFVVAPPSPHSSGKNYEWVEEPRFDCMADLPEWVIKKAGEKAKKDWSKILQGVPKGERNDTATALMGKLLLYLPMEEWEVLGYDFVKWWNERNNNPPLPEKELDAIFESIAKRELSRRHKV